MHVENQPMSSATERKLDLSRHKEQIQQCLKNHNKLMRNLIQCCLSQEILPVPQKAVNKIREQTKGMIHRALSEIGFQMQNVISDQGIHKLLEKEETAAISEMSQSAFRNTPPVAAHSTPRMTQILTSSSLSQQQGK